jgi:ABC-type branched-subunit amino acid transport system substrate-binding protein
VVVSQVFPYERSIASPVVKEAMELAKAKNVELSPIMLEGFVSAKVVVEGLRRAGPGANRERLRRALEGFNRFDLGGLELSYSATDHSGLDYADLSIIGPDGRFRR